MTQERTEAFTRLLESACAVFSRSADASDWLITANEELGGRAPVDFLADQDDANRIDEFTRSLKMFEFIIVRPGELVIRDRQGLAVHSLAGRPQLPLSDEQLAARAMDWLMEQGWHVMPMSARLVLARRK